MNTPIVAPDLHHELIPLSDGRLGLRRGLQLEIQNAGAGPAAPNGSPPILDFIASNQTLDRFGEIILGDGWRLDNYRRNPVFQNAHQYGDILFTLGKALVTEVRELAHGPALFQRVEFAVEVNPMARIAYGLYRGGFLNAVSVGFIPLRWEEPKETGWVGASALPQEVARCVLTPPYAPAEGLEDGDHLVGTASSRSPSHPKYQGHRGRCPYLAAVISNRNCSKYRPWASRPIPRRSSSGSKPASSPKRTCRICWIYWGVLPARPRARTAPHRISATRRLRTPLPALQAFEATERSCCSSPARSGTS